MEDLKRMVGQHFVVGFPGTSLDEEFIQLVKEYKIGNVILFRRNVESKEQLRCLCEEIQTLVQKETGHPAFITIDQEGGVVTRLSEDFCNVPEEMALAATGDPENMKICAGITARQLLACGVNFNLAPVLDINNNPQNPVIGVRSYGDIPERVVEGTLAAIEGYRNENMLSCGKHFPGHGDTAVDSHLGLPVIDKSEDELRAFELIPFEAAIRAEIPAIMTSHILFPKIEKEKVPCTMSRTIITDLLKEKLGFDGLVMSDCMEMNAIKTYYGSVEGALGALRAGVDLVCISYSAEIAKQSALAVYRELEKGTLSRVELEDSTEKILTYKEKYRIGKAAGFYSDLKDRSLEREIRKKTIVHFCGGEPVIGEKTVFIGCDSFCVTQVSNPAESRSFTRYMAESLTGKAIVTGTDPTEEEIAWAVDKARRNADSIVMCTYNMHLKKGQQRLLKKLAKLGLPMTVVAMRNPYDLQLLPEGMTGIEAWDYSAETLELLAEIFRGEWKPAGRMPISVCR